MHTPTLPNALNLIVLDIYLCSYRFSSTELNICLILIHISVYILNVHGLGETNSLRI